MNMKNLISNITNRFNRFVPPQMPVKILVLLIMTLIIFIITKILYKALIIGFFENEFYGLFISNMFFGFIFSIIMRVTLKDMRFNLKNMVILITSVIISSLLSAIFIKILATLLQVFLYKTSNSFLITSSLATTFFFTTTLISNSYIFKWGNLMLLDLNEFMSFDINKFKQFIKWILINIFNEKNKIYLGQQNDETLYNTNSLNKEEKLDVKKSIEKLGLISKAETDRNNNQINQNIEINESQTINPNEMQTINPSLLVNREASPDPFDLNKRMDLQEFIDLISNNPRAYGYFWGHIDIYLEERRVHRPSPSRVDIIVDSNSQELVRINGEYYPTSIVYEYIMTHRGKLAPDLANYKAYTEIFDNYTLDMFRSDITRPLSPPRDPMEQASSSIENTPMKLPTLIWVAPNSNSNLVNINQVSGNINTDQAAISHSPNRSSSPEIINLLEDVGGSPLNVTQILSTLDRQNQNIDNNTNVNINTSANNSTNININASANNSINANINTSANNNSPQTSGPVFTDVSALDYQDSLFYKIPGKGFYEIPNKGIFFAPKKGFYFIPDQIEIDSRIKDNYEAQKQLYLDEYNNKVAKAMQESEREHIRLEQRRIMLEERARGNALNRENRRIERARHLEQAEALYNEEIGGLLEREKAERDRIKKNAIDAINSKSEKMSRENAENSTMGIERLITDQEGKLALGDTRIHKYVIEDDSNERDFQSLLNQKVDIKQFLSNFRDHVSGKHKQDFMIMDPILSRLTKETSIETLIKMFWDNNPKLDQKSKKIISDLWLEELTKYKDMTSVEIKNEIKELSKLKQVRELAKDTNTIDLVSRSPTADSISEQDYIDHENQFVAKKTLKKTLPVVNLENSNQSSSTLEDSSGSHISSYWRDKINPHRTKLKELNLTSKDYKIFLGLEKEYNLKIKKVNELKHKYTDFESINMTLLSITEKLEKDMEQIAKKIYNVIDAHQPYFYNNQDRTILKKFPKENNPWLTPVLVESVDKANNNINTITNNSTSRVMEQQSTSPIIRELIRSNSAVNWATTERAQSSQTGINQQSADSLESRINKRQSEYLEKGISKKSK